MLLTNLRHFDTYRYPCPRCSSRTRGGQLRFKHGPFAVLIAAARRVVPTPLWRGYGLLVLMTMYVLESLLLVGYVRDVAGLGARLRRVHRPPPAHHVLHHVLHAHPPSAVLWDHEVSAHKNPHSAVGRANAGRVYVAAAHPRRRGVGSPSDDSVPASSGSGSGAFFSSMP